MKRFFKDNENRISFLLFVITIAVAILPLISRYCINGHDLEYHLLRIESLKEGILIGKPFLKVNTLFFGGAGYASSMFYSDLFMYIPALLRVMGVGIGASYHIFVALIFILCYGSTYYCTYKIAGNKYTASLAAIILTLAPYHLDDMLVRAACGEYMAFVFVPFVVYGIYNILFEDMSHPAAFAVGFGGLILTHPATLVFNVLFAIGMFVLFIKTFIKKPILILKVFITTVITMLVTSFYWLPMLEQMISTRFYVSENPVDMLDAALNMSDIFSGAFPGAGSLILVILIPRIFMSRKEHEILKFVDAMILAGLLFAIGSSNILPWSFLVRFLSFVQFPWRLLTMTTMLMSIAGAIILSIFIKKFGNLSMEGLVFVVAAVCCMSAISHNSENQTGYFDYSKDYYDYAPFTATVIGGEWLPATVTDREALIGQSIMMTTDDGTAVDFTRQRAVISADIPAGTKSVNVPFIYYKGYVSTIEENGTVSKLTVTGDGINGMSLVNVEGHSGQLKVWYEGTAAVKISAIISILTVIALALFFGGKKKGWIKGKALQLVVVSMLLVASSASLSACDSIDASEAIAMSDSLKDMDLSKYADAPNLMDALLNGESEEEVVEEEVEEINYISYKVCEAGYENEGRNFAIKVDEEPDVPEYLLVSIDEAEENDTLVIRKSGVYAAMASDVMESVTNYYDELGPDSKDEQVLSKAIMNEADMLLFLEYYGDDKRADIVRQEALLAVKKLLAFTDELDINNLRLMYNMSAVLGKAKYILDDEELAKDLYGASVELFEEAEAMNTMDTKTEVNRAWAAAEIFRISGIKTYRTVVESLLSTGNFTGYTYENPGYYAAFAYLNAPETTDYSISGSVMSNYFDAINEAIKSDAQDILNDSLVAGNISDGILSDEYVTKLLDEIKFSVMANRISMSVEYTKYAKDRIMFLGGANPTGINYLDSEHIMNYEPVLFGLMGVEER